ncbi:MAG: hypothetical protein QM308_04935 [Bacillota bacterium]|nr:hypothetical protein [Bacillota bacterium]
MNKKFVAILCVVVSLVLMALPAFAEDWFCPNCGKENSGNFCYNCGEKKPAADAGESVISDLHFTMQENGDVLLTWDDSAKKAPYTVKYQAEYDRATETVQSKSITLEYLIPGETYSITVSNDDASVTTEYKVPHYVYTGFNAKSKKLILKGPRFSVSEVERDKTKQFELQVRFPQLKKERAFKGKIVTKTPLGYGGTVLIDRSLILKPRVLYSYYTLSMHEFFEGIREEFDDVPLGLYTIELYLNGELYSDVQFSVVR